MTGAIVSRLALKLSRTLVRALAPSINQSLISTKAKENHVTSLFCLHRHSSSNGASNRDIRSGLIKINRMTCKGDR